MGSKAQDDRVIAAMASLSGDVAKIRGCVVRFVRGYRGARENHVTRRDIERNFPKVDRGLLSRALLDALDSDEIAIAPRGLTSNRRARGAYVYFIPQAAA